MTKVVDSFEEDGLAFDVYSDGDCVVRTSKDGFIQISSDILKRIMSKPGKTVQFSNGSQKAKALEPSKVQAPTAKSATKPLPPTKVSAVVKTSWRKSDEELEKELQSEISRKIAHCRDREGWLCTFLAHGKALETHIYQFRSHARAGDRTIKVGEKGRIE